MRGAQGRTSLLSQQTPVGFGSSSPRRISTPVTNGAPRSGSNASVDRNPMSGRSRTSSNSSIPIPTNLKNRTRTPTGTIQRSGSNLGNRTTTSNTTTAYGADGSRVTTTRTSSSYQSSSQAGQQSERNW